ncbi:endonuclease [archaeon]|nr:endonuclease [archaeon]|tara:strand:+ start:888 stop:1655 length:768 start_codon:yes stop_codon:yes gene_type:complete
MVKLVCYNIEYCEGMEGHWYQYLQFWKTFFPPKNIDKKIAKALKEINPDILALVEVDIGSFRAKKDEVRYFKKELGLKNIIEKVKYPFKSWLKLFHYIPILNKQANAILSNYKFSKVKYHLLSEGTKKVVIEATVHCPKKTTLLLAHLALGKKARVQQIKELTKIVKSIKNPVILMGDFNTFNGIKEINNLLKETNLKDKIKLDKKSNRLTQPAWKPTRRLDYVLVSKEIKVKKYQVLQFPFSDHLPLFVEFSVR